jgi:hypothetical protein
MKSISNDTQTVQIQGTYEEENLMTVGMFNDRAIDLMVSLEHKENTHHIQDVLESKEPNKHLPADYVGAMVLNDDIHKVFDYNGFLHIKYNNGCLRAINYKKKYTVKETFEVVEEVDMWDDLTQFDGVGEKYNRYKNIRNVLQDQLGKVVGDLFDDSDSVPVDVKFDITDKLGLESRESEIINEEIIFA